MTLVLMGDMLGAGASLLATVLFTGLHKKAWFISLIAIMINIILYGQQKIYADTGLEFFYFITTIYGAITWSANNTLNYVYHLSYKNKTVALITILALYILFKSILPFYDNALVKNLDALTTALSLVAQYLMCRRYIETWILWFITDALYFFMYSQKNLFWHSALMLIYLIIAIIGYWKWYKTLSKVIQGSKQTIT